LDTNNNEEIAVYELTSKKYLNPKGKVEIEPYHMGHMIPEMAHVLIQLDFIP